MASVLAIVSKALFEKMVPKTVALGAIVDLDEYVSSNKAFDGLGDGDAIFMVTVRPPKEALWLVAILESPKKKSDAWKSAANTTPLTDVTSAIKKFVFESGTGLKAKKGALGMSLQTPRVLTGGDVKVLRGLVPKTAPAAGKRVSAGQAYLSAVEEIVGTPKSGPLGSLRFDKYRRPFDGSIEDLSKGDRLQITALMEQEGETTIEAVFGGEDEEGMWTPMEIVDVVDVKSGKPTYQFYFWPYGSGALFTHGTVENPLNVCQHHPDWPTKKKDSTLLADLAKAWAEGKKRLKIQEVVIFESDSDSELDE